METANKDLPQKDELLAKQAEEMQKQDNALSKQAAEIEARKRQMEAMKK